MHTNDGRDGLAEVARAHLDPHAAEAWIALLRPAVRLEHTDDASQALTRLGGLPRLPRGHFWPRTADGRPLSFVAEVDLEALASSGMAPGLSLPTTGRLLAFRSQGAGDAAAVLGVSDDTRPPGALLWWIDAQQAASAVATKTPRGAEVFPAQFLRGRQVTTFPDWEHPILDTVPHTAKRPHDGHDSRGWASFTDALPVSGDGPRHQLGGWADPLQSSIEYQVARTVLGDDPDMAASMLSPQEWDVVYDHGWQHLPHNPERKAADVRLSAKVRVEVARWRPLLQVDSDSRSAMMWGDSGTLYWLCRPDREDPAGLSTVAFTWQSC